MNLLILSDLLQNEKILFGLKIPVFIILYIFIVTSCNQPEVSQFTLKGGPCEGCEAVLEYGEIIPDTFLIIPGFDPGKTQLRISGYIYKSDGLTPASDVILYVYHTDSSGVYSGGEDETGWGKRHGISRGWLKTGVTGGYSIITNIPGVYPDRSSPAHIHATILEPSGSYYWIEEFLFSGDSLINAIDSINEFPRGGSNGILELSYNSGILTGSRDIILGKNIPDY